MHIPTVSKGRNIFMLAEKRITVLVSVIVCLPLGFCVGAAQSEELSSTEVTAKAWLALKAGDYKEVSVLTEQCFKEFGEEAEKQQSENRGQITQDNAASFPELNSVGTCLFILGQSLVEQGEKEKSSAIFTKLIESCPDCYCENEQGYYWKPAKAADKKLGESLEKKTK